MWPFHTYVWHFTTIMGSFHPCEPPAPRGVVCAGSGGRTEVATDVQNRPINREGYTFNVAHCEKTLEIPQTMVKCMASWQLRRVSNLAPLSASSGHTRCLHNVTAVHETYTDRNSGSSRGTRLPSTISEHQPCYCTRARQFGGCEHRPQTIPVWGITLMTCYRGSAVPRPSCSHFLLCTVATSTQRASIIARTMPQPFTFLSTLKMPGNPTELSTKRAASFQSQAHPQTVMINHRSVALPCFVCSAHDAIDRHSIAARCNSPPDRRQQAIDCI